MGNIAEQRYREGSGERFLKNGEVRCQAISKGQMRRYREEHEDWDTPSADLWPECQCVKAAIPGTFVCYYHGGGGREKLPVKNVLDVIPLDLREKVELLMGDPNYISHREDIAILRARQWELLQQLEERSDGEETWGLVSEALYELRHSNEDSAAKLLEQALKTVDDGKNLWKEYYTVEKLVSDNKMAEVKTAKELQSMATAEQVGRLMNRVYEVLTSGAEKYIEDKHAQSGFLRFVAGELNRAINFSPATVIGLLESGSGEED